MTMLPILNNYGWYSWSHLQISFSHYLGRVALLRFPTTLIKMILSSLALSIMTFSITIIKCDTQHNRSVAMVCVVYAECHYAECHMLSVIMVSVIMVSVIMLSVILLSVIMLCRCAECYGALYGEWSGLFELIFSTKAPLY
jgi:hypothetical protein